MDAQRRPEGEKIEARFLWTPELLREVDRMQSRSPIGRWRWLRLLLALLLLFAVLVWSFEQRSFRAMMEAGLALTFGGLLAGMGIWLLFRLRAPAWRRARLSNSPQLHGETHMVLDAEGVRSASAHVEARYRWSVFTRIARTDRAVGLQVGLSGGWLAIPAEALDRSIDDAAAQIEAWRSAGEDQDRPTVQAFE